MTEQTSEMVTRLVEATNAHDIDALVACFSEDYVNEAPLHPTRNFTGSAQVRRNWEQIFGFVPDVHAEILRSAVDGDTAWTEWRMTGTRRDGSPHRMGGTIIFTVRDGVATAARFYLDPVDETAGTVDEAVLAQVARA